MTESQQQQARRIAERIHAEEEEGFAAIGPSLLSLCETAVLLADTYGTLPEEFGAMDEAQAKAAAVLEKYGGDK